MMAHRLQKEFVEINAPELRESAPDFGSLGGAAASAREGVDFVSDELCDDDFSRRTVYPALYAAQAAQ